MTVQTTKEQSGFIVDGLKILVLAGSLNAAQKRGRHPHRTRVEKRSCVFCRYLGLVAFARGKVLIRVFIRRHAVIVVFLAVSETPQQEIHIVWWRTEQKVCDMSVRRNESVLKNVT